MNKTTLRILGVLCLAAGMLMLALLVLTGCVHLPVKGDKPICLLDYKTGVKACEYDTWEACHADLREGTVCYHR